MATGNVNEQVEVDGVANASGEASVKSSQNDISELYVTIFNRASEGEGNENWQEFGDMDVTIDAMFDTSAAKEYFGDTLDDNKAFIEHIYKNTLGKTIEEDADGINAWTSFLDDGKSRAEVVSSLIDTIVDGDFSGDIEALKAQTQFNNRVEVSNKMADTVFKVVNNFEVATAFDGDLEVTADSGLLKDALADIDGMVGDVAGSFAWATEESVISDTVTEFLTDVMPDIKADFSGGMDEAMNLLENASVNLQKDIDTALEKLGEMDGELASSMENMLAFFGSVDVDTSVSGALDGDLGGVKGSLGLAVEGGELSEEAANFIENILPDIKADLAAGVKDAVVDISDLAVDIKAEIDSALASGDLAADVSAVLSLFGGQSSGSASTSGGADAGTGGLISGAINLEFNKGDSSSSENNTMADVEFGQVELIGVADSGTVEVDMFVA